MLRIRLPRCLCGKESTCQCKETWAQSLGLKYHLEEEMATPVSCLENPIGRGAQRATVCRVAKSWT